jgi:hypothetical protein
VKVLIFGTCYCGTPASTRVLQMWMDLILCNQQVDGEVHHLLVDSQSPQLPYIPLRVNYYTFKDNIGHLSKGGRDGWGRAFSYGLWRAVALDYDYVVHIESDSLLSQPIGPILRWMEDNQINAASTHLAYRSLTNPRDRMANRQTSWVETGLMFFNTRWLIDTDFIQKYDWEQRTKHPEPEIIVRDLVGQQLRVLPWQTMRDDFKVLTPTNLKDYQLQWLTHADLPVMEKFYHEAKSGLWDQPS